MNYFIYTSVGGKLFNNNTHRDWGHWFMLKMNAKERNRIERKKIKASTYKYQTHTHRLLSVRMNNWLKTIAGNWNRKLWFQQGFIRILSSSYIYISASVSVCIYLYIQYRKRQWCDLWPRPTTIRSETKSIQTNEWMWICLDGQQTVTIVHGSKSKSATHKNKTATTTSTNTILYYP